MKNFRTNKTFISLHIVIFSLLIIFALNESNRQTQLNVFLLIFMLIISVFMLLLSFMKSYTVLEDKILVKSFFRTIPIEIENISYGYVLSAMGRYVLIINDRKHTVMISSLMDGFNDLVNLVSSKIVEEERKSFNMITEASLKRKYVFYAFVMTLVIALLIYGNITSYNLI